MKVLVTGADGFIGSHLAAELVRRGAAVTALALYNSFDGHGWLDDLPADIRAGMELVRGDIRDAEHMTALCQGQEVVFHLAALIAIPYSYMAPSAYVQTNVQGTTNVLLAARAAGVRRVVHTSTSEVYGTALFTPITEEHPLQGQSPYSASKIGADMMATSFARSFELPVITLRPFNTYGPRQSERAIISTVIRQALDPAADAIRVGDLRPKRDFTFVQDTAEAFLAVAGLGDEHVGKVFNGGTGRCVTMEEVVTMIRRVAGCDKPVVQESERMRPAASEVMTLLADWSALNAASGWQPRHDLEQGLSQTVEWWRSRLDRLRPDLGYMR
ncbi:MAG: SDR family NAD(P)-dependent oxidoreductase [Rhodospirillaceae bacterium]|nr:SDR family NAD(P)-dependent oxidoreductase [Rhodospirillales bacterium]